MARKSRWQQFTDNFNGVYGAFNEVGKQVGSKKAMDAEYLDDDGIALKGPALDRARTSALADVYTNYGDAKGGLGLRTQVAQMDNLQALNDLNLALKDHVINQKGNLTTQQMGADIDGTNARTNLTGAQTGKVIADTTTVDALRPGQVTGLDATNRNLGLTGDGQVVANSQAAFNLGVDVDTRPDELARRGGLADQAVGAGATSLAGGQVATATVDDDISQSASETTSDAAGARVDQNVADVSDATTPSNIDATITENNAREGDANLAVQGTDYQFNANVQQDLIMKKVMAMGLPLAESQAEIIKQIEANPDMGAQAKLTAIATIQKHGLERLTNDGLAFTQSAENAAKKGGLDGLVEFYDKVNDDDEMSIVRDGDKVSVMLQDGDASRELFSGSEAEVMDKIMAQVRSPGTALSVAANVLNNEKTASQILNLDREGILKLAQGDQTKANTLFLQARLKAVENEVKNSNLTDSAKAYSDGLAEIISSDFYMNETDPAIKTRLVQDYKEATGMSASKPANVSQSEWDRMSDEDKLKFPGS